MEFNVVVHKEDADRIVAILAHFPALINDFGSLVADRLKMFAEERSPVQSGRLRAGWTKEVSSAETGVAYVISTGVPYAPILEEGLYKQVGPRTVQIGDKIYSKHAVGGIVGPILRDEVEEMTLADALDYAVNKLFSEMENVSS